MSSSVPSQGELIVVEPRARNRALSSVLLLAAIVLLAGSATCSRATHSQDDARSLGASSLKID